MNDWTVRTRIIAAFATAITIMDALGAASFVELGDVQEETTPAPQRRAAWTAAVDAGEGARQVAQAGGACAGDRP